MKFMFQHPDILSLQMADVVESTITVVLFARVEVFFLFMHTLMASVFFFLHSFIQYDFLFYSRVWAWPVFDPS
jgi:hypothetical protein